VCWHQRLLQHLLQRAAVHRSDQGAQCPLRCADNLRLRVEQTLHQQLQDTLKRKGYPLDMAAAATTPGNRPSAVVTRPAAAAGVVCCCYLVYGDNVWAHRTYHGQQLGSEQHYMLIAQLCT
jgi:hypothetical protein